MSTEIYKEHLHYAHVYVTELKRSNVYGAWKWALLRLVARNRKACIEALQSSRKPKVVEEIQLGFNF